MLSLPNSKINLGLNVTEKRKDGFHNISSVFYPVNWRDVLEVIENKDSSEGIQLSVSGMDVHGDLKQNLIYKAWELISANKKLPAIKVHLHKNIPMGAGLGGGSADAAFFINMLNQKFELNLNLAQKLQIAAKIGSDCSFFIENKPVLAYGKGDEFYSINFNLEKYYILIVYPNIHSDTREAYSHIIPKKPETEIKTVVENFPVSEWKNHLTNDFEKFVFKKYPLVSDLKQQLYANGALYASMSGSGSAVFGIFDKKPVINFAKNFKYFLQNPTLKVLF